MILGLLLYGTTVALLLTLGGLATEPIAARLGWPRRGIWAATLLLSIVVPVAMVLRPHSSAATMPEFAVDERASPIPARQSEPIVAAARPAVSPAVAKPIPSYALPAVDRIVETMWIALSAGASVALALSLARLRRARGQWRRTIIDGSDVWVTQTLGPAVFGFFRPQILIPQWVLDAPAVTRSIVLIHEREHIDSRDPLLLFFGFLAVLLAPWNLPLWWQLKRLRFTVEVDCDARVLRTGTPLPAYGDVLIAVSQRGVVAPLGAMAIAEAPSQLERRIRIMASLGSRPARWLIGTAVAFAGACIAFALDMPAPTLHDAELRKPPYYDSSPYLPKAEAAARAAYPDLFKGQFNGTVALAVDLNRDGAVLAIHRREFPSGPLPEGARVTDIGFLEFLADLDSGIGNAGRKFVGWFGPQRANGLYLYYSVLKWPHDPARSAARVLAAVALEYPEFFRSYPPDYAYQKQTEKLLTVFMNDDGTINRARLTDGELVETREGKPTYDRFLALGLKPDQFGHRGWTFNAQDVQHLSRYPNAPRLDIFYAWPRRPDDPPDVVLQSSATFKEAFERLSRESDDRVPDATFLKRYLPDIWERGPKEPSDAVWILLDLDGVVCDNGRSGNNDFDGITKVLMTRYPGTRIGPDSGRVVRTPRGRTVNLDYMRLKDDSPLTSCQSIASVQQAR